MRKMQQFRSSFNNGKKGDVEKIGEVKKVADSIADHLLAQTKVDAEDAKGRKGVNYFKGWEDLGEIKRPVKGKASAKPAAKAQKEE